MNRHHKIFYGSSYDRALDILLFMWAEIKEKVPDAELHIAYGWDLFDKGYRNNPERQAWKNSVNQMMDQEGIYHYGRIGKEELRELRKSCGIWAYPTYFDEINCHPAGTFIETLYGDKKIEELTLSDAVRTNDGTYRYLTAIRSRVFTGDMVDIRVQCGEVISVTPDHPIYVIPKKSGDSSRSWVKLVQREPQWVNAEFVKPGDIVLSSAKCDTLQQFAIDLSSYEGGRKNNFKIDNIEIDTSVTNDKIWWLGYFAGDGNANSRGKISCLVADRHYERDYQRVVNGFRSWGLNTFERKLAGCVEIYSHSYKLSRYLRDNFYDDKKRKILPADLLQVGKELLLDGLISSDGCVNVNYKGGGTQFTFTNKSRGLISQVRTLLSMMGIATKVHTRIHDNGGVSYFCSWIIYKNKNLHFHFSDEEYLYRKVSKVNIRKFDDIVYNIDVGINHTYHANGYIVHNCITALECQNDGLVPVVINRAALQETVGSGYKINGDIQDITVQDEFVQVLVKLLRDQEKWKFESKKAIQFAKGYDWTTIAREWVKEFEIVPKFPKVSIITVTIREGWWNIMAHNLSQQIYKNFEWIIVDDHKQDRSHIAKKYAEKYGLDIKYIRGDKALGTYTKKYGLCRANNKGWKSAQGELLVWLQDFILIEPQSIERAVDIYNHNHNALQAPTDKYYFPNQEPDMKNGEAWFDIDPIGSVSWVNVRNTYKGLRETNNPSDFEMNFAVTPKHIVEKLNGWWEFFDVTIGYDNTEFAYRALQAGYKILVDDVLPAKCLDLDKWVEHNLHGDEAKVIFDDMVHRMECGELKPVREEKYDS